MASAASAICQSFSFVGSSLGENAGLNAVPELEVVQIGNGDSASDVVERRIYVAREPEVDHHHVAPGEAVGVVGRHDWLRAVHCSDHYVGPGKRFAHALHRHDRFVANGAGAVPVVDAHKARHASHERHCHSSAYNAGADYADAGVRIDSTVDRKIPYRDLIDLRDMEKPLHGMPDKFRHAHHLVGVAFEPGPAPAGPFRLGHGLLELGHHMVFAEERRLESRDHAREVAERVVAGKHEVLFFSEFVEAGYALEERNGRNMRASGDARPYLASHRRDARNNLYAAARVEDDELANALHAPYELSGLRALFGRQVVRGAPARRQDCVRRADHHKFVLSAASGKHCGYLVLRVARASAGTAVRGDCNRQPVDMNDSGRGEVPFRPVAVRAAAKHARSAACVEYRPVDVLVVRARVCAYPPFCVVRRKHAPRPLDAAIARKRGKRVRGIRADKLNGSAAFK